MHKYFQNNKHKHDFSYNFKQIYYPTHMNQIIKNKKQLWIIPSTDQDWNPILETKETDQILIAKCMITCPVNTNKSLNHHF
jgi:hypothetical protein